MTILIPKKGLFYGRGLLKNEPYKQKLMLFLFYIEFKDFKRNA